MYGVSTDAANVAEDSSATSSVTAASTASVSCVSAITEGLPASRDTKPARMDRTGKEKLLLTANAIAHLAGQKGIS